MSLGTSNRDGGKTSESGHLRALGKMVNGDIIDGLAVSQRGAGANMSVDIAVGDALLRRSDGSYSHPVFNDAVLNQAIDTADGSNPRRDIVVLYLDYAVTPSTAVSNNTNGVVKVKVVKGTPAGSPADPSDSAIQSSVGSGNPWTKLARVRLPAGQSTVTNSLIDDLRSLMTNKASTVSRASLTDAMKAIADYSTSEKATDAQWIDGKTIYKKTISTGTLPNNTNKFVNHGISSLSDIIKIEGYCQDPTNSIWQPLPMVNASAGFSLGLRVEATQIRLQALADLTAYTESYVTLYYTKTS